MRLAPCLSGALMSLEHLALQAQRAKFAGASDRDPIFWLKHDPVRLLDGDASLGDAKLPGEARIELAVSFPGIEMLPDSRANKVPDPSKGTPLQPPGAFAVSRSSSASSAHHLGMLACGTNAAVNCPSIVTGPLPCTLEYAILQLLPNAHVLLIVSRTSPQQLCCRPRRRRRT